MLRSLICGSALILTAMLTLQGCGRGDESSGTTVTTTNMLAKVSTIVTSTTTTMRRVPGGLLYCEDIDTFYRVNIDANGTTTAVGQCIPSSTPGAYYTRPGEKAQDGRSDREWSCWSAGMENSSWTNEAARSHDPAFEGACVFKDYGIKVSPDEVEYCSKHLSHHPSVCSPGPAMYWGACWSSRSESWKCIPKNDKTISGLARGDCKAQVLLDGDAPTNYFYDGVCRFQEEPAKVYRCDTVPSYIESSASTCGGGNKDVGKACFTLKRGIPWQCFKRHDGIKVPCDWVLLPDGSNDFYKSSCVFPSDEAYADALNAYNLTTMSHPMIV